ncbi:MAG: hypothetical protein AAFR42_04595 [Cyanobacteria bacterium J06628_6]
MNYFNPFAAASLSLLTVTALPITALAQTPAGPDEAFLNDVYSSLEEYDALAYALAVEFGEDNITLAQQFCSALDDGAVAEEEFTAFFNGVSGGLVSSGLEETYSTEQLDTSSLFYSIAILGYGTFAYCPQHGPALQAALQELGIISDEEA